MADLKPKLLFNCKVNSEAMDIDKTTTDPKSIEEGSIYSDTDQRKPTEERLEKGREFELGSSISKLPTKDKRVSESRDGLCKASNIIAVLRSPEIIDIHGKDKADSGAGTSKVPPAVNDNFIEVHSNETDLPANTSRENETVIIPKEVKFKKVPHKRAGGCKVKLTKGTPAKKCRKRTKDKTEDYLEVGSNSTLHSITNKETTNQNEKRITSAGKRKRYSKSAPLGTFEYDFAEITTATISYPQTAAFAHNILFYVFRYLELQDLLIAMRVCTVWQDIANDPLLWKTVRMKYFPIHNIKGFCNALHKHKTVHLDMRKICLPRNTEHIWVQFNKEITKVSTLKKIELNCCPAAEFEEIAISIPNLEVLNAVAIDCASINLDSLVSLKNIKLLRLKSTFGYTLSSDLGALAKLNKLQHLSLTTIKGLSKHNIEVIAGLTDLVSLDLGDCTDFPQSFGHNILARLSKLKKLRLERGEGNCCTLEILDVVSTMHHLEELELINFEIKIGFDNALGACSNIKKLLIIPTYVGQVPLSYGILMLGVLKLKRSLTHFKWCITSEFQELTEMFFQRCQNAGSRVVIQSLPFLDESPPLCIPRPQNPELEMLFLPNIEKLLLKIMPTTHLEIIKMPFCDTWNQTITDMFN